MESAREARRRRILERGSDRLAFITGQSPSVPLSPAHQLQRPHPQSTATDATLCEDEPKKDFSNQTICSNKVDGSDKVEPSPECEISPVLESEMISGSSAHGISSGARNDIQGNVGIKKPSAMAVAHQSSDEVFERAPGEAPRINSWIFTPNKISNSISASEDIRLLSAIIIGVLVVLSSHGLFLGGKLLNGLINFRPLFLVILTDATIVLGRILVSQGSEDKDEPRRQTQDDGWADNLGKTLEAGLVLHKAMGAIFMDCSICAVMIICGAVV